MKLIIDRAKWIQGKFADVEGNACAVGHLGLALGAPLTAVQTATGSGHFMPPDTPWASYRAQDSYLDIISINDGDNLSVESKEYHLTKLFTQIGVEVEFTGELIEGELPDPVLLLSDQIGAVITSDKE